MIYLITEKCTGEANIQIPSGIIPLCWQVSVCHIISELCLELYYEHVYIYLKKSEIFKQTHLFQIFDSFCHCFDMFNQVQFNCSDEYCVEVDKG